MTIVVASHSHGVAIWGLPCQLIPSKINGDCQQGRLHSCSDKSPTSCIPSCFLLPWPLCTYMHPTSSFPGLCSTPSPNLRMACTRPLKAHPYTPYLGLLLLPALCPECLGVMRTAGSSLVSVFKQCSHTWCSILQPHYLATAILVPITIVTRGLPV